MRSRLLLLLLSCAVASPAAGAELLVQLDDMGPGVTRWGGFELLRPAQVDLEVAALVSPLDRKSWVVGWILEADSRRVVWTLGDRTPSQKSGILWQWSESTRLPAGVYEVHYAAHPSWELEMEKHEDAWWASAAQALAEFFGLAGREEAWERLAFVVRGPGRPIQPRQLEARRAALRRDALVSLEADRDHLALAAGFELDRALEVELYAVGELLPERGYDFGWILRLDDRERVWTMSFEDTHQAGGGSKNRVARAVLHLPPGRYAAHFVTDDSHSPASWNALPPFDPAFWGLLLRVRRPEDRSVARQIEVESEPGTDAVLSMVRIGDDAAERRFLAVTRPTRLRVHAVGEGNRHGMVDYGWIGRAADRETVWEMTFDQTTPAGGRSSNRMAESVIELEPDIYVVTYVTDGSHAFGSWAGTPPFEPERWGLALFPTDDEPPPVEIRMEAPDDPLLLAQIEAVGDDEHVRRPFHVDSPTRISVRGMGEGFPDDEMADRGWISEARRGRVLWTMTYEASEHAGGADKNRLCRGTLLLPAGDYVLHYETDDSHAYGDWNAAPPREPQGWGIRIRRTTGASAR